MATEFYWSYTVKRKLSDGAENFYRDGQLTHYSLKVRGLQPTGEMCGERKSSCHTERSFPRLRELIERSTPTTVVGMA